jgi:hypothetical protein
MAGARGLVGLSLTFSKARRLMRSRMLTAGLLGCLAVVLACHPKATAPVPGTINSFDAYAARVIGDSQEALLSAKAWELCSDAGNAPFVTFDGQTRECTAGAPAFPVAGRPILFKAELAFNTALAASQTYHATGSSDTTVLAQAITQLGIAIGDLLTGIGRAK